MVPGRRVVARRVAMALHDASLQLPSNRVLQVTALQDRHSRGLVAKGLRRALPVAVPVDPGPAAMATLPAMSVAATAHLHDRMMTMTITAAIASSPQPQRPARSTAT